MTFTKRKINLTFQLGQGDFGAPGQDTITLEGLRCSVNVVHDGIQFARADIQVWGMTLDQMNRLTVTQKFFFEQRPYNSVQVSAGDETGMNICFSGGIMEAWADGRQQPDVMFHISAASGLIDLAQTIPPTSFNGATDVATVVEQIAGQIGYGFENNGVSATLNSPYKPGSPKAQIEAICRDADCAWTVDDAAKTVSIWPKNGSRAGDAIEVSASTGLLAYPAFTQGGLQLTTLYNPSLDYGRLVKVATPFAAANGQWTVRALSHRLETNVPNGQWFTDLETSYLDFAA